MKYARTDEFGRCKDTCDARKDGVCTMGSDRVWRCGMDKGPNGNRPGSTCPASDMINSSALIEDVGVWEKTYRADVTCSCCKETFDCADQFDESDQGREIEYATLKCPYCGQEILCHILVCRR